MTIISKLIKFIKNTKISIPVAVVLLLLIFSLANGGEEVVTHTISKEDFIQTTRVSGKVVPQDEAGLSFNTSGRVSDVNVNVGDEVRRGDVLAVLDRDDLEASLSEAQANLQLERSQFNELSRGTRDEEIKVQEVRVQSAEQDVEDSLKNLINALNQTYTSADTIYNNGISQVFRDPFGSFAKISPVMNVSKQNTINDRYQEIIPVMNSWYKLNNSLTVDTYNSSVLSTVQGYVNKLQDFSSLVAVGISDFEPILTTTQEDINAFKADLSSERSALDSSATALTTASKTYEAALNDLRLEQSSLDLLSAGSTSGDLEVQSARIAAQSARVSSARAQVNDSQIIAPFDGIIAKKTISVGEYVDSKTEVFVLVAPNGVEIESYIPELLIRNVNNGDPAKIKFDAYPDKEFKGEVSVVDTRDTLRDGVTTYKTSIQLIDTDETPVRIGMTVDILIEAYVEGDVLLVPSRAIVSKDGVDYVVVAPKMKKQEVVVGDRDSNGNRAIVSGLVEGDIVVVDPEEK